MARRIGGGDGLYRGKKPKKTRQGLGKGTKYGRKYGKKRYRGQGRKK